MRTSRDGVPDQLSFRPHLLQAPATLAMALFFGALWYGVIVWLAPVDMSCRRYDGHVTCDVTTELWPSPSIVHLTERDLADAALVVVPQKQDRSFQKLELTKHAPSSANPTVLVDFSQDLRAPEVEAISDYLAHPSGDQISKRIVAPAPNRAGLLVVQLMTFVCIALMILAIARRTTITSRAGRLEVYRSYWPWKPVLHDISLRDIAEVTAVSRIPEGLAKTVASLPWRNIYRANALSAQLKSGEEVLITEWSKRSLSLHRRLASSINAWRAASESPSEP